MNKALTDIARGYANLAESVVAPDPVIEELSVNRMIICSTCPNKNVMLKLGTKEVYNCKKCKCPLSAATRSPNYKCPEGKW